MTLLFLDPQFRSEWLAELRERGVFSRDTAWLDEEETRLLVDDRVDLRSLVWVKDIWPDCVRESYRSIGGAQRRLREIGHQWSHVSFRHHRRGELIAQKLGSVIRPIAGWPSGEGRTASFGGFFLLSESELIWCRNPRERFPGGKWVFSETAEPPSRAYLKLWEWGWRSEVRPQPGGLVYDLAAYPGGWSWVLLREGCTVKAFDRTVFEPEFVSRLGPLTARIQVARADIFSLRPEDVMTKTRAPSWVFCDVIAEPERTVGLFETWCRSPAGLCFTIKFKGREPERMLSILKRLRALPTIQVAHLSVNKHEFTAWRPPQFQNETLA